MGVKRNDHLLRDSDRQFAVMHIFGPLVERLPQEICKHNIDIPRDLVAYLGSRRAGILAARGLCFLLQNA